MTILNIQDRIKQGRKARAYVNSLAKGTVSFLRETDALFRARSEEQERRSNIKRMIALEMLKAYAIYSPEDANKIVSEAHEEVRRNKGVQS